jgi:TM2 domain-containing membrane protein YozV
VAKHRPLLYLRPLSIPNPIEDPVTADTKKPFEDGTGIGYLALVLSWLIPGIGHFIIGEKARGLIFALTVQGLFAAGLFIGGIRAINPVDQPIWTYTQFLAGWPMLVANPIEKQYAPSVSPNDKSKLDALMDTYIAQRPPIDDPSQNEARKTYAKDFIAQHGIFSYHPKVQDIGSVYCGIAGMLNLLVMFDVLLRITGAEREKNKKDAPIPSSAPIAAPVPSTGAPAQ